MDIALDLLDCPGSACIFGKSIIMGLNFFSCIRMDLDDLHSFEHFKPLSSSILSRTWFSSLNLNEKMGFLLALK